MSTSKAMSDFASDLARMKGRALELGLPYTARTIEVCIQQAGWEIGEIITGKHQYHRYDPVARSITSEALGGKKCCECSHSPDHGACDDFERGMNGRCVYCDHDEKCHPGKGETFNLPLGIGTRR